MHPTRKKIKLLLVDDDQSMVRMLTATLEPKFGDDIDLVALEHPQAAVQWIRNHVVDILVTDLEMPKIDGLDLLKEAKRSNACSQVFFITGHSTLDSLVDAMKSGATDYLLKPLDRTELTDIIEDACKRLRRWQKAFAAAPATGSIAVPIAGHLESA